MSFFRKILSWITIPWNKRSVVQRIILIGIIILVLFGIGAVVFTSIIHASNDSVIPTPKDIERNDLQYMTEFDRNIIAEQQLRLILQFEEQLNSKLLNTLQSIFTKDRVRSLNIKIDMDMSKITVDIIEYFPITIKPRSTELPYDDSERVASVILSESTSHTSRIGYNKEEIPMGNEIIETSTTNFGLNSRTTKEEKYPTIKRITVSVNIDGIWKIKLNENHNPIIDQFGGRERVYFPISPEDIQQIQILIQNAIGYDVTRGDSVTVHNIPFDRSKQFAEEDAEYFNSLDHGKKFNLLHNFYLRLKPEKRQW